jgi:hypothetical protein
MPSSAILSTDHTLWVSLRYGLLKKSKAAARGLLLVPFIVFMYLSVSQYIRAFRGGVRRKT